MEVVSEDGCGFLAGEWRVPGAGGRGSTDMGDSPRAATPESRDSGVMNGIVRPRQGRVVAGVCAAVANRFGWNTTVVRILTVIAVVFFGLSLWAYLILWLVIPTEK